MFNQLPKEVSGVNDWTWAQFEPYFQELQARDINAANVVEWLNDWRRLSQLLDERRERLRVGTTIDTNDQVTLERYNAHLNEILPPTMEAEQRLKEKLLASGLKPQGFEIPLRDMQTEAALFREENVPLLTQEDHISVEYDKIVGAQTVQWNGEEKTIAQIQPIMQSFDRAEREQAWRLTSERQLADRDALNDLWTRALTLRTQIAGNADMPDYRAYRWRDMLRFDYTPDDTHNFHKAIEEVVVPAALRIYEKRRRRLGVDKLRPWDLEVDTSGAEPLRPFDSIEALTDGVSSMFHRVDPQLGEYFDTMRRENLLDLENRKGKGPGGYCTYYGVTRRPFIFMNAVGLHDDVQTLLHEGGHAFHGFEYFNLPLYQQTEIPVEFCEVASMSMELLAAPYFTKAEGGVYETEQDAARARLQHLEGMLLFWPYMAVVDAFQHWAYTYPEDAKNPANCDAKWGELWDRFMIGIDYSGLEDSKVTGWHRKLHIFQIPFYYIEYGLAQLGAVQVWRNSLTDQAGAVAAYRRGLALGGTVTLPQLFEAAGARFAMDADTLRDAVELIESTIDQLEQS
jgi:oligoendopeptidase F